MVKSDLISAIVVETGVSKATAEKAVNRIFQGMEESLKRGKDIKIHNLFRIYVQTTKARKGFNPQTKKPIQIPSKKRVRIKGYTHLSDIMNKSKK